MELPQPNIEHICHLQVHLDPILEMGAGRAGHRRIIPIVGGTVTGDRIQGEVMNLGADWQTIFESGLAELDTRYAIKTHDGAIIEVKNYGFRHGPKEVIQAIANGEAVDPSSYYMRTHARLETGDPRYDWVNKSLFVGTGARMENTVAVDIYQLV